MIEKSQAATPLFQEYASKGFKDALIPIIPLTARLSRSSHVKPNQLGKIPGIPHDKNMWNGFLKWTDHETTDQEIGRASCRERV